MGEALNQAQSDWIIHRGHNDGDCFGCIPSRCDGTRSARDNDVNFQPDEIGCERREGEDAYFVRDNGVGFDIARAQRLFKPFERMHGSRFTGSGVGLSIVKRIVDRHGGKVWAESAPGQGATFYFGLTG